MTGGGAADRLGRQDLAVFEELWGRHSFAIGCGSTSEREGFPALLPEDGFSPSLASPSPHPTWILQCLYHNGPLFSSLFLF